MKEIEVKVLNVDVDLVKSKIISLGGVNIKKEHQENYFFNMPNCDNGYIRIRKIQDLLNNITKITLCVKKIFKNGIARENIEHEFEVSSFDECLAFLNVIGISKYKREDKYRESYILNDSLIEFDTWSKDVFPYPYIEIEAPSYEALDNIISILQIPKENITSKGLLEIKKEMGLL